MKKNNGHWLGCILLLFSFAARAQTYTESALLFSRINPGGSARIQALGGAQVSLGGDYSSAYSNPAGLGMYHRSEFTFSPAFNSAGAASDYLGTTTKDSNSKIIVPGASLVFYLPKESGSFLGGAFGISFNRTNNFNQSFTYQGSNAPNSLLDAFIEDATGSGPYQFDPRNPNAFNYDTPTELAYHNYLIRSLDELTIPRDSTKYYSLIGGNPTQHEQVLTQGSQSQINLSYGANFNDKLFVGFGVGLTSLNYQSKKTYTENFSTNPYLTDFSLTENLTTKGSGINATLGMIYKPLDIFQFGVSIATPTAYALSDSYEAFMTSSWKNFPYNSPAQPNLAPNTDVISTDYSLNTPWKFSGGGTFFIKKYGFITADVEMVNYSANSYTSNTPGVPFDSDNASIKSLYINSINYRLGAEFRLNAFRFRGGYNFMPDPYKSAKDGVNNSIQSFSTGVGYRTSKFYVDATAVFSSNNGTYRPYIISSPQSPIVTNHQTNTLIMFTVGFPF